MLKRKNSDKLIKKKNNRSISKDRLDNSTVIHKSHKSRQFIIEISKLQPEGQPGLQTIHCYWKPSTPVCLHFCLWLLPLYKGRAECL